MTIAIITVALLIVVTTLLIVYIIWMKWRARHSKPRFAFFVVSTLFALTISLIAALTSIDWILAFKQILFWFGIIDVSADAPVVSSLSSKVLEKALIVVVGLAALVSIQRFGQRALRSWEGPLTINAARLKEDGRPNHLLGLALAEVQSALSRQNDPVVDQRVTDWKQHIAPAPGQVEFKELARTAFLNHLPEAIIEPTGWRRQSNAWVGIIHGPEIGKESELIVLIFTARPSKNELQQRIALLRPNDQSTIFVVIEDPVLESPETILQDGLTFILWGYPSLIRAGLPLSNYARYLIKQFSQVTVGGTQATLAQTFVKARVKSPLGIEEQLRTVVDNWISDGGRKHLAITGEYGQGKSTAMLELCVDWAKRHLNGAAINERVPLLIELRGKSPGEASPIDFLAQWGTRYGLQGEKLFDLIQSGQAILIFEGFDELKNAGRQFERHEHFNALWRFAYPGTKIIFTGRPNFFIDQTEKNSTLRVDENVGAASNAYTELYAIQMFNEADVIDACRAYPKSVRDGITKTFHEHPDFREIVSRPSMLPVVGTIWPEIQAAEESGQSITGSMLLERYLSAVYTRKEAEIENERRNYQTPTLGSYLLLPRAIREALTLSVVWEMAVGDLRNTISRSHFDRVIEHVFDNVIRAMQSAEVRSPTLEEVKQLAVRMSSETRSEFLEKVCTDVASAGLFVPDPVGGTSNLRFAHKQYLEYLIAKYAWLKLAMPQSDVVKSLAPINSGAVTDTLWISDAFGPFNRILGSNLTCFANSVTSIRFAVFATSIAEASAIAFEKYSQALKVILSWKLVTKKKTRNTPILGFDSLHDGVLTSMLKSTRMVLAITTAAIVVTTAAAIVVVLIRDDLTILAKFFLAIPVFFSPVALVVSFVFLTSGPAQLFLDICRKRLIGLLEPNRSTAIPFKGLQQIRRVHLKFIHEPGSRITIHEVVTGVKIPSRLTEPRTVLDKPESSR